MIEDIQLSQYFLISRYKKECISLANLLLHTVQYYFFRATKNGTNTVPTLETSNYDLKHLYQAGLLGLL